MTDEYPNIQSIQERLQSLWAPRDALIEEMRAIRYMERAVEVPEAMEAEVVQTPVAHQIVERMTGTLTANPMTLTVPPASEQAQHQEQSSQMEKFALAALNQLERQADRDVRDRFVENLIADGHGCLRMLYAIQLWRGFPRRDKKGGESESDYSRRTEGWKRGKPLPISWSDRDPLTIYPEWSEIGGLHHVLEVAERDVLTLDARKWNVEKPDLEHLSSTRGKAGRSVTFQQLWTPDTLTYAVEGQVVHHTRHRYGAPPYAYAFGLSPASDDPKYMGLSVLYPVRHLVPYLDTVLSQKASAIRMYCWPTPIYKQVLQQAEKTPDGTPVPREIELAPGRVVTIWNDEDIGFLVWQGNGPDADEMIQLVTRMIERAGLADSMYGQGAGESGYALNQLIGAAKTRYRPLVAHAERALGQQVSHLFDIVEYQHKQAMHVYSYGQRGWVSIGPDDLNGYRQVQVKLNPVMPTDTYARSSQALNENRGGLRSVASAMEMIGIEQPDEEIRQIMVDSWRARPEVAQFVVAEAVKRAGLRLARGGLTMGQLQSAYPELAPNVQEFITQQLNATAPAGQTAEGMGMAPQGGEGAPAQVSPQLMQAIQMLAQRLNMQPQVLLQQLMAVAQQRGIPLEALVRMLLERLMAGQPQQAQQPAATQPVMAAPGVRAVPTPPRVGPITRPQGIATGREPGTRRRGNE